MKNKFKIKGNSVLIYCNSRRDNCVYEVIIDKSDFERIKDLNYSIYYHKTKNSRYYAFVSIYSPDLRGSNSTLLHRFILGNPDTDIDHINGNTLDNRRKNLREVSDSNNSKNRKSKNSNNTSGYRNVTKMNNFWRVQLQINGKNTLFPEKFENVHEAGKFAEKMRNKYYGEFAGKN